LKRKIVYKVLYTIVYKVYYIRIGIYIKYIKNNIITKYPSIVDPPENGNFECI